ncbi:class-III aminotransferase [Aeropyrum pernix K1]|uniref:Ornithine aminotransferase n=1 Tax=Aeropyrum pernix (strain ATCC 700893 / DSM 11879 / JCM 9820 / NBRC 100138 / K1) TaxID=272557 RepID=Q9YEX6_AERPE|nr:acetyl ornithine aminotransferase family protein [Aeropyrum pernix]BAA79420.1 class-III aminotransferase [Aeropyrum pernix K1]
MAVDAPRIVVEPPGPRAREVLERDERVIMQSFTRWYPLVVKRGYGAVVEDVDGNRYIDFNAGIAVLNVGHNHPRVVEAVKRQLERFLHYSLTDFYYEEAVSAAERLARSVPISGGAKTFFTNSGAESIEASIKVVRAFFRGTRPYIISFLGGFHGRTYGAMSASASKPVHRARFYPLVPGFIHAPYPDPYRCPFPGLEGEACGEAAVSYIEDYIFSKLVDPGEVAAFLFEPIQGEGGYVVPPDSFLPSLQKLARKHGILLIADEVQTGFARTGRMFAVEHWGVEPDVMALAKAMGGGLPLGAAVGRSEVMSLPRGSHANTFGGNPVALAAFNAVMDVIEGERLWERSQRLGEKALKILGEAAEELSIVGHVRGKGLMIGVELVRDENTREPHKEALAWVLDRSFKRGLLVIGAGVSAVRIAPPLTIEEELFDRGLEILVEVLREADRRFSQV